MNKIGKLLLVLISICNLNLCSSDGSGGHADSLFPTDLREGDPVIFFSDLTSAPNSGWSAAEPGKGAAVTIWGKDFGDLRENSYVSVGGVKLERDSDYVVWGEYWPTRFWQRITFWINDTVLKGPANITVTVNGRTSNIVRFSVTDGRIFFVDNSGVMGDGTLQSPYTHRKSLQKQLKTMKPGDIWYYRAGTYTELVGDYGNAVLSMRNNGEYPHGTKEQPMAFIAYPGEKPLIKTTQLETWLRVGVAFSINYATFSGFSFNCYAGAASLGNYTRFVGNDVLGLKVRSMAGTGTIITSGSGAKILGNAIRGGRSKNRFDHAIYFSGAPVREGSYLGWNYIHDNDFGRGPEIAINHQDNRVPATEYVKSHFIFNNIVDARPQRATFINIFDLSWDTGEANYPEPVFVYNNIFLNGGTLDKTNSEHVGWAAAIVVSRDSSRFYNNILYDTAYIGFQIASPKSTIIQNNIVAMNSDNIVDQNQHFYVRGSYKPGVNIMIHNLFYDMGSKGVITTDLKTYDLNTNKIGSDPLFADPINYDFRLLPGSAALGIGTGYLLQDGHFPEYAPLERGIGLILKANPFDLGVY